MKLGPAIAVALILAASACAPETGTAVQDVTTTQHTVTTNADVQEIDTSSFGDFPPQPSNQWLIAAKYEAAEFTDLAESLSLQTAGIEVQFGGRSHIALTAGGCSIGNGTFELVDGRIAELSLGSDLWCAPTDPELHAAAINLIEDSPEIRVDGDRLLLLSSRYRLELLTTDPGVSPSIHDNERFVGLTSTIPEIDATRITIKSPIFFVIHAILPGCEMYGGTAFEGDITEFQMEPAPHDPCKNAPATDKAAQAFLNSGFTANRNVDSLQLTNDSGSITLVLTNN